MKVCYFFLACLLTGLSSSVYAQCPPPGFPSPGNACSNAPILCENLDGYCTTINNTNVTQTFPGCPGWQLNNDEWFGFFAGSTTITIEITPSNCSPGNQQGLQGAIYAGCGPPWVTMDNQCSCTEDPFILTSNNFVVGQVYYIVMDGCAGNVCDLSIDVLAGSTVAVPPGDPGPMTGPLVACQGQSTSYSIPPVTAASIYIWALDPASGGTITNNGPNATVVWGTTPGPVEICVNPANLCDTNFTTSCLTVEVQPKPTATISGSGFFCFGDPDPIDLTINFTGDPDWRFVYTINGVAQPQIITSDNPYILTVTQPGVYALQSVAGVTGNCPGMVSGSVTLTEVKLLPTAAVTNAVCGNSNGAINLSVTGGTTPYMFNWSSGETTEDLSNIPPGAYTVTITDANGCTEDLTIQVPDDPIAITLNGTVVQNTTCLPPGNGSITTTVSPTGTYTYDWSSGETTPNLSNLPPGSYTLTVTLGVNCTQSATFTVDDNPNEPTVTFTQVNTTCDLNNGSINASVSGGVAPYTFLWSSGETTEDLGNIPAGNYELTVTGANGCTGTANVTIDNNNPPFNVDAVISPNTTCLPPGNGAITLNVAPPGAYTYTWSGGETTPNLSNIPPGTYTITVSAGGSCIEIAEFTVDDEPNEPTINYTTVESTCDLNNGSINTSISGGVAPYSYMWSNGFTSPNLVNIPAGTYDLTVTGANGCTAVESITVDNNNPPINVDAVIIPNTSCLPPGGNGGITLNISPAGTYTYTWSGGQTTPNLNNLPPGTYTVTVSGGGSCIEIAEFDVPDEPNAPDINYTTVESTCDLNNGSINTSISGGVTPYTYLWSTGATTANLPNIPAGNYDLTVTGANGCTTSTSIIVDNNNPPITVDAVINPNTSCSPPGNGSIILNISPAGTYTYTWSGGQTTPTLNNLPPGTYTVTVNGGGSCIEVAEFDVPDEPNEPNISFTTIESTCDLSNGSINVSVSGGVSPYTYLWSNGATSQDLTNIPSGAYDLTVTGANGCIAVENIFLDNNNPPIDINANIVANTACIGGTGSISLTVSPPGSYTYLWSTGQTTPTITNLPTGTYEVTVNGGGSCIEVASFDVPDNANIPDISFFTINPTCEQSNGFIDLTVFGGIPPYTYQWSSGQTTQDINNQPPGLYLVTVTGANGCSTENGVNLDNEDIPITLFGDVVNQTSCVTNNGSITLDLDPPNLTISWSNGSNQPFLNNLAPGTYTVTVSAGGTCTDSAEFTVEDNSESPFLDAEIFPATCGFSNGSINLEVYDGIPPYSYQWSNSSPLQDQNNLAAGTYAVTVTTSVGCSSVLFNDVPGETIVIEITGVASDNYSCMNPNGFVDIDLYPPANYTFSWSNGPTTQDINNLPAGTYTVSVTLGVGCSAVGAFDVYENTDPPNLSVSSMPAVCGQPNGSASVAASGGSSPYTYLWSNAGNTPTISNLTPGTYSVTVTGFFGCTATSSVTVVNTNIAVNITGVTTPNTSCSVANGAVNITATPAAPYTYTWSNSATTEDLSNVPPATYTVTVSAGVGCSATASFVVANNTSDPVISPAVTASICGLSNGAIDLTVSGGTTPYVFAWSNTATTEDLANILAGNYTVTITDGNGCTADTTLNVPNNASTFSLTGTTAALTNCLAPNGSVNLTVTPAGAYTYLWSNSATTEDISNLPAGTYTVSVTELGDCTASASFVVSNGLTYPGLSQSITAELCGLSDGAIDLSVAGGAMPFTYLWSGSQNSEDLSNIPMGTYTVTVTGANGCSATTSATVPENLINFSIAGLPIPNSSCVVNNGSINLTLTPAAPGAGPGYSFIWSNSATTEDLSGLPQGSYTVTVSAGGTCTNVANYNVANVALPPTISENIGLALCGQSSGSINLTISGGSSPYTFLWSTTAITEDVSGLPQGTYTVIVTGANGCTATKTFLIDEDVVIPAISGIPTANTSCVASNGSVNLSVSPNTLSYTYLWSTIATTQNISNLAPGTYSVTVNGGGSCTNTASFVVGNNTQAPVIANTISAALCGQNSGSINLTISSGNSPFTYKWSNNATGEDLIGIASGTYSVTVTGANGCTSAASFVVPENTVVPAVAGTLVPNSSCIVDNGSISLSVTPTTLVYTYLWASGQTTANLSNLAPGNYTVTVYGGGACTNSATFAVGNISGAPTVTGIPTDVLCFGATTGAIDLTITGGAAPYTIKWTPNIPGNPVDPTNLPAGNYNVVVTDTAGCATTVNFSIKQPAAAVQLACTQSSNVTMPGATDGAGTVTITGGVAPYAITWSPGGSQANLLAGPFPINNLGVGNYLVTVTDANGCTAVCNFTISIINCETALGVMQGNTLSLCGVGCLAANYNNIGQFLEPGDVLQFILHTGSGAQIVNELARSTQPEFCFDAATMTYGTTYYISAAAGNNDGSGNVLLTHFCTVITAGTPIIFREKPVATATQPGPLNCVVAQVGITGSSSVAGSTFQWSTSTGQIIGSPMQAAIQASAAGQYQLIVAANGCSDTTAVDVLDLTNQPEATVVADPNDILDCKISQIILSGDIKGTNDANSIWLYNGTAYAVGTVLTIDAPGTYQFIIIDTVTFCSDTALIEINENLGYPPLTISPPGSLNCINSSLTLSGASSIPGIQFNWGLVNGSDTTILGTGPTVNVNAAGTYVLIGLDPVSHCTNSLGTSVSADFTYPVANAGAPFSIDCFGETAYLDGGGSSGLPGFTYLWTTTDGFVAAGANTPVPEINQPGTYNLLVTNPGNGCTDTDQVLISPDDPVASVTVNQPPCVGDKGSILVDTVIGGAPPIQYSINNGQTYSTNRFFKNLEPGSYTILVEDANGCETSVNATIDAPTLFEITLDPQILLKLGDTIQIQTGISVPLNQVSQVQWTPSDSLSCDTCLNPLAWPVRTSRYHITVISNTGCEDDAFLVLAVDRRPSVYIPNIFSPDSDGENSLFKIYADPRSVRKVKTFQVFSRWGELVYEYYNFDPNSPAYGWDGTLRGQKLNPAVFGYFAVIEFIDGQEILYEGDVTLKR